MRDASYLYLMPCCTAMPEASAVGDDDIKGEPEIVAAHPWTSAAMPDVGTVVMFKALAKAPALLRCCSRVQHFKRCCGSKPASSASVVSSTVTAVTAQVSRHPRLVMAVSWAQGGGLLPTLVSTIWCVAGLALLHDLGLHPRPLQACK